MMAREPRIHKYFEGCSSIFRTLNKSRACYSCTISVSDGWEGFLKWWASIILLKSWRRPLLTALLAHRAVSPSLWRVQSRSDHICDGQSSSNTNAKRSRGWVHACQSDEWHLLATNDPEGFPYHILRWIQEICWDDHQRTRQQAKTIPTEWRPKLTQRGIF